MRSTLVRAGVGVANNGIDAANIFQILLALSTAEQAAIASQKISHWTGKTMIPLRLELRTACVLDRSDNQLHHRTN